MSDILKIKSKIKDYKVNFINDFTTSFKECSAKNIFVIVDEKLLDYHGDFILGLVPKERIFKVEAIEENKTLEFCHEMLKRLIQNNIRRNNIIVAIGGGIIQDITAFVSSVLFRGVSWVFYPTTLLSQADSCIGSKSSINMGEYKNLLGGFYPPSEIFIDINFLKTLPADEIKSGIGEMLHFYLIAADNTASDLMSNYDSLINDVKSLKKYILPSLQIKKKLIEIDEFDKNERNIFNYGHTFGHAIETVSNYLINHGQAVTMGMDIANYVSLQLGYLNASTFEFMHNILAKNLPNFKLSKENIEKYLAALSKDKKNIGNDLGCILTKGPGAMEKLQLPLDEKVKEIILDYFYMQTSLKSG